MKLEKVLERLRREGFKLTNQRREIISVLARCSGHLGAEEIYCRVRQSCPRVSLDTIYRNLRLLTRLGLVTELKLEQRHARFELRRENHCHHLVCLACGERLKLPFCPLEKVGLAPARRQGFEVKGHTFVVYGYCRSCRQESDPA